MCRGWNVVSWPQARPWAAISIAATAGTLPAVPGSPDADNLSRRPTCAALVLPNLVFSPGKWGLWNLPHSHRGRGPGEETSKALWDPPAVAMALATERSLAPTPRRATWNTLNRMCIQHIRLPEN